MYIEDRHLRLLADLLSKRFLDHPWRPNSQSIVNRIILGIIELERAEMDWIEAIKSDRFREGMETVGRILAYPDEPGMNSEPRKLQRMLGISDDGVEDRYSLLCGITFPNIGNEDAARAVWEAAADIGFEICVDKSFDQAA
jgi:hypothetical protein